MSKYDDGISVVKENFSLMPGGLAFHFQIGITKGVEAGADFMLFSVGQAFVCHLKTLNNFLSSDLVRNAFILIRFSEVDLRLAKFSPRLPMVDCHFIFLNLKHARINDLLGKVIQINHHLKEEIGINYEIIGLIEKNFLTGEVVNFFSEQFSNMYGEQQPKLNLIPYSYCEKYRLMTAYPEFDSRVKKLILANISQSNHLPGNFRYWRSSLQVIYCRRFITYDFLRRSKMLRLLRGFFNTSKYELQKKYLGDSERSPKN